MWMNQTFEEASRKAQESIRKSTEHLRLLARNSPADAQAQSQAKAAVDFCKGFKSVSDCEESQQGTEEQKHVEEENGDSHPIPASSDNQTAGKAVPLPHERYLRIISFVDGFDVRWRSKTLALLCSTSHIFRHFAEQFLYTRPPELDTIGQQWHFLFTLTIKPRLRNLIRSLHLRWWMKNENGGLIVNIVRSTPSLQALTILHEGPGRGFSALDVSSQHVLDLASLFGLCPKVTEFKYHTDRKDIDEHADFGDDIQITPGLFDGDPWAPSDENSGEQLLKDPRFVAFARQLTHLDLDGETELLEKALTSHLSTNLRALTIKQSSPAVGRAHFPKDLPQRCPHLEKLWVFSYCLEAPPLLTACLGWANTLRDLYIGNRNYENREYLKQIEQWITRNMSKMVALQHLELDMNCWTETFGSASKHHPPRLASLRIKSLSLRQDEQQRRLNALESYEMVKDKFELNLCHFIVSLGETLESIHIGRIISSSPMPAGKSVLSSCKQAPNLTEFWAVPGRDAISSDVDDLLDTCPKLHIFPPKFLRWTWREDEWTRRKEMYCLQDREERLSRFRLVANWLW